MEHTQSAEENMGWVHFLMKRLGDQQPFHKSVYGSLVFLGFHKIQFLNIPSGGGGSACATRLLLQLSEIEK